MSENELMHISLAIPDPLRGSGRLFLWGDDDDLRQMSAIAQTCGLDLDAFTSDRCLAVHVSQDEIINFLSLLRRELRPASLQQTRALFKPGSGEPTLADFPRADTLVTFIMFARGKWLGELMSERRLLVHYQPIVEANQPDGVHAHEALARGRSREGELIDPLRMLSAASDAGLLAVFDSTVHELAVRGMADAHGGGRLFLNLSPRSTVDPNFQLEHVRRLCRLYRMPPEDLVFEITEREHVLDVDAVSRFFREAQDEGFGVALDDLGSGFSNLNLIHQLRPNIVKLDMELTRNIHQDEYKRVIAGKIIEASAQLDIDVIAEGVEQPEELEWLRSNGARFVQGYLVGRPDELPRDTQDLNR